MRGDGGKPSACCLHCGVGHWPAPAGARQLPALVMGGSRPDGSGTRQVLLGFELQDVKISFWGCGLAEHLPHGAQGPGFECSPGGKKREETK